MLVKMCMWLAEEEEGGAYLGLAPGLQLVFVVAEPLVIEAYVFCQGADLLQPHFLCERALDAVALMNDLSLETKTPDTLRPSERSEPRQLGGSSLGTMAAGRCVWGRCLTSPLR